MYPVPGLWPTQGQTPYEEPMTKGPQHIRLPSLIDFLFASKVRVSPPDCESGSGAVLPRADSQSARGQAIFIGIGVEPFMAIAFCL
jgi:hypothetical protein